MKTTTLLTKSFRHFVLAGSTFIALSLASNAVADPVQVQASDITGGTSYDFSISSEPSGLGNYNAGGTGVGLVDNENFTYFDEPGNATAYMYTSGNGSPAVLILGFNFSGSGFTPTQMTLTANMANFESDSSWTYSYSTDNFDYTPFYTGAPPTYTGDRSPHSVDLPTLSDDTIYVEITATSADVFTQLGRSSDNSATPPGIEIDFASAEVPEPSTVVFFGIGLAVLLIRLSRRSTYASI